ncbi:MAG: PH domain-containing protein [Planctomycetota bacterium]|nr:PH domain-containing protein [Planctomycetota bacterium]
MKQAIAGVSPSEVSEVNVMEVWPSIAMFTLGRLMGRLFAIKAGIYIFRVGNFCALAGIPFALALYFFRLAPSFFGAPVHGGFYRLTNRRVIVLRNEIKFSGPAILPKFIFGAEVKSVELDRFDAIDIERLPGHHWYDAGDLVFRRDGVETFRLAAVSRPEPFRHTCLKSHGSYVGIKKALARQPVHA